LAEIAAKTSPDTVYLVTKEYTSGDRMSEFERFESVVLSFKSEAPTACSGLRLPPPHGLHFLGFFDIKQLNIKQLIVTGCNHHISAPAACFLPESAITLSTYKNAAVGFRIIVSTRLSAR